MVGMTSIRDRMFVDRRRHEREITRIRSSLVKVTMPVTGSYLTVVPVKSPPVAPYPNRNK